jgi:hypothetical protein
MDLTPFDVLCFIGGDGEYCYHSIFNIQTNIFHIGTFHECVNGLLKRGDGKGSEIPVAMIAGGTGNSFSLELLGDTDLKLAVETVIRGIHVPIDVGKVVSLNANEQGGLDKEVLPPPTTTSQFSFPPSL